jgi:putative methionine-R-sulfoxide reductase with GAF domain
MEYYSILDNSPSQAAPETAPPNLVASGFVPSKAVPENIAPAKPEAKPAAPSVREALRFPGEDGGKSLSEMAQRDLDATLQLLVERAQYITGASGAAIALRQGETMVCCASSGASAPELGAHLQIDSGLSAESVKTRQILHCDDAENDPRVNRESCRTLGIASVVVMPLVRDEEVYGVFELLSGRPRAFEQRDHIALNRLAEMIQTAVEHSEAARRAEKELGKPAVAPVAETKTAEVAIASQDAVAALDSAKTAPGPDKKPAAAAPPEAHSNALRPVEPDLAEPAVLEATAAQPAPQVVLALEMIPAVAETLEPTASAAESLTEADSNAPITTIAFGNLRRCETCGFPVSEGRRLCLDCEAASPGAIASIAGDSGSLDDLSESNPSWVRSHIYLIATAVVALATIALLAWRL